MSLVINKITVSYQDVPAVNDVNVQIKGAAVTALIGPNGAGKSTLLKAIAGLLPCQGQVILNDHVQSPMERARVISYMPQDTSPMSSLTLLEVVLLGRLQSLGLSVPVATIKKAHAALARFGLQKLATRALDEVSGGQRQLVYLAQALFREPSVLLLDEPTAALDLRHQLIVLEALRKQVQQDGITTVVAMHDLSLAAQFADQIVCMHNGSVDATGTAEEVIKVDRLRKLYGVETEISHTSSGHMTVTPLHAVDIA